MNILKQSTAATVKLGAFVDDSDGKTAETGLTISQADIRLSKNGGDFAQTNNATGATHDEFGYYDIPLDATDTNTLGRLLVAVHESGALPVWQEFLVVTANVYDTLCSTDTFDVNVTAMADDVITAGKFDESTAFPLKSADTGSTQVARVGADSDTLETLSDEIAAVKAETALIVADTNELQTDLVNGGRLDLLIDSIVTHLTDIKGAGWTTQKNLSYISSDMATDSLLVAVDNKLDIVDDLLDTEIAAILADTNELQTDLVNGGRLDLLIDSIIAHLVGIKGTGWTNQTLAKIDSNVDSILADTGTDGVKINATQGAITWGQQKIVANVALEGALDISNSNSTGYGQSNYGGRYGLVNTGELLAGQKNQGTMKNVDGFDPALALEATLTAIKGSGWTDETLVKIITDISNISAGSGATPQQVWEYASRTLTDPNSYKADVSALATTAHVQEVEDKVDIVYGIADAIIDDTGTTIPATLGTMKGQLDLYDHLILPGGDLYSGIESIKAKTDLIPASPAEAGEYTAAIAAVQADLDNPDQYKADVSALATTAHVQEVEDKVDTADAVVDAIKTKTDNLPASPAEAGEYTAAIAAVKSVADDILEDTGTTLDTLIKDIPTNTELATALGTADDAVLAAVAAAKAVIDNIHDTDLPAVKAETALIVEDTGTTLPATLATLAGYTDGIAGDVWSYAKRTLTHPSVSAEEPEDSNTLILYRDADIAIELTDLTIPAGAKKYIFTIKDNLDSGDDQAVLQASYAIDGSEVETNTLVYINSAAAPVLTNPVTFTLTDTNITIDLTAEAAALLPRYERGYLNWDLKLVTDAAVTIVLQGLAQIIGTSTRAIE